MQVVELNADVQSLSEQQAPALFQRFATAESYNEVQVALGGCAQDE